MIVEKLMRKSPFRSRALRAVLGGTLAAVIVSVAVVVGSSLLGFRISPGVAVALAAVAGASHIVRHPRSQPGGCRHGENAR